MGDIKTTETREIPHVKQKIFHKIAGFPPEKCQSSENQVCSRSNETGKKDKNAGTFHPKVKFLQLVKLEWTLKNAVGNHGDQI